MLKRGDAERLPWAERRFWEWLDALAQWPRWVPLGLSMVLAASVGYLLEQVLRQGPRVLSAAPDAILFGAGVVAAVFSAAIWGATHASAARRGAFIHAVAEDRMPRHLAEDALLRSTVAETWPRSVVMPLRAVALDQAAWQDAAASLAHTIGEQAEAARVAHPGTRGLSILVGGPSHVLALAGALSERRLRPLERRLSLIADDTSDADNPFVEFSLGLVGRRGPAEAWGGDGVGAVLLLRQGYDASHVRGVERHLLETYPGRAGDVRVVTYASPIPERSTAYRDVASLVDDALVALRDSGVTEVFVQCDGPASLAFAAGFTASRLGMEVASMPFVSANSPGRGGPGPAQDIGAQTAGEAAQTRASGYDFSGSGANPWAVHEAVPDPGARPRVNGGLNAGDLGRRWWGVLLVYSFLIGVGFPVFAGSVALVLEWVLARSQQGEANAWDWVQLVVFLLSSLVVLWVGDRFVAARLDRPALRITADPTGATLRTREAAVPPAVLGLGPAALAQAVTTQFGDLVAALPKASKVTVHLGDEHSCPAGRLAIEHPTTGLKKSLRSRLPVDVEWNGMRFTTRLESAES